MSGNGDADEREETVLRVRKQPILFALQVLAAYNFILVIFFAGVGPPVASLPTFFGAIAGFATTTAALVSRAGAEE
jgi:ABC-type multidrug transport system permease subunit